MNEDQKPPFPAISIKNLLVVLQAEKKPILLQNLQERFNFDYYNPPDYIPIETALAIFEYLRRQFYSDRDYEAGVEALGAISLEAHFQGALGYVNKIAIKLVNQERLPGMIVRNLRLRMPYSKHFLEEERKGYLRYRQTGGLLPPAFTRGLLKAIFNAANAKNIRVIPKEDGTQNIVYEVFWD